MRSMKLIIGLSTAAWASAAPAGVFTDDLTRCLISSASAADERALVRWIFLAASTNPDLAGLSNAGEPERAAGRQAAAEAFNRLLLSTCRTQAVEAIRREGEQALAAAFEALGESAGRRMVSGEAPAAEASRINAHLDLRGIETLLRDAGVTPATGARSPTNTN